MPRTAILYVTERCNQACVFCLEDDGLALRPDVPRPQVLAELASLRARGAEHLTFMGGETFLRKDLPELLEETKKLGFTRVGVTTNGTALGHEGFLDRMIRAGLDFVEISVHSDGPELAERISGKPFTWERQRRALAELQAARDRLLVIVNVVVCRENHAQLTDVLRVLLDDFPRLDPVIKLKFVSIVGAAERDGARPLRYDEVDLAPAIDLLQARGATWWSYNFPLCRLPPGADAVERCHESVAFVLDWTYYDYDHRKRDGYYDSTFQLEGSVWPTPPCGACALAPLCPGVEETYRRIHGEGELGSRADDPLPVLEAILRDAGMDPSRAPEVLARLEKRERPARFVAPVAPTAGEAALVLQHPAFAEAMCLELRPADGRRAFDSTPSLALSYRRMASEPGDDANGRALLDAMERALVEAHAAHESVEVAAARLASSAARVRGWTCVDVRLGGARTEAGRPLAIRVPARQ
jgi:organic radical activating enzyme